MTTNLKQNQNVKETNEALKRSETCVTLHWLFELQSERRPDPRLAPGAACVHFWFRYVYSVVETLWLESACINLFDDSHWNICWSSPDPPAPPQKTKKHTHTHIQVIKCLAELMHMFEGEILKTISEFSPQDDCVWGHWSYIYTHISVLLLLWGLS